MHLPSSYKNSPIWLTIDVEELNDTNFKLHYKKTINLNYEKLIDNWLSLCDKNNYKSTAFVLGSFAKKYPHIIKKLSNAGHEIASHGLTHDLVYDISFQEWSSSIVESKKILEDITGSEVKGYRSASWSLPFDKKYYEELVNARYSYSSSYFPFKTYLYGNSIDRKHPFEIHTDSGTITEIPVPKLGIPFSGGFYLRMLPQALQKIFFKRLIFLGVKPIIYIHPYELTNSKFITRYYYPYYQKNVDFFLAFGATSYPLSDIDTILRYTYENL